MIQTARLRPDPASQRGNRLSSTLLETALQSLRTLTGSDGALVVDLASNRRVVASTGASAGELAICIDWKAVHGCSALWIADTSLDNAVARSSASRSMAVISLDRAESPNVVAVLLRSAAGAWNPDAARAVEALAPLLMRIRDGEDARQSALDLVPDLIWVKNCDSRYVVANQAFANAVYAGSPEEVVGQTDFDLYPDDRAQLHVERDREVMESGRQFRVVEPRRYADGIARTIEIVKRPMFDRHGTAIGIIGTARDLTAHYEAGLDRERLLAELEMEGKRLEDTVANMPGVVWEQRFDGSYSYVSNHLEAMFGYSLGEYRERGGDFRPLIHPDDRELVEERTAEMVAARSGGTHEFRVVTKEGSVRWCESHCSVILDGGNNVVGMRGVSIDITDRRIAEELLRESEERFGRLVHDAPAMLWTVNTRGECDFMSRRLLDYIGEDASDPKGSWIDIVHPEDREETLAALEHWLRTRTWARRELRVRSEDGFRNFLVEAAPRFAIDGTFLGLIGSCVDVTERDRLEQYLEEKKRMASLGRLAATIAHEINNVLMGIQPFAATIARTNEPAALERAAAQIANAVERGRRITHEILHFTHSSEPAVAPVDVTSWMEATRAELEVALGNSVAMTIEIEPELHVRADALQLQQIFMNLATNARDAIAGRGFLSITARTAAPDLPCLTALPPGSYAHFEVRDNGSGIAPDTLEHLFEPLFTTKANGTGLGLAIIAEIVRKHEGDIFVRSQLGAGTTFHIVLPATEERPSVQPVVPMTFPESIRRILLVEDDQVVATGLAAILELDGIESEIASTGAMALPMIDSFDPDVVLLDVGLPDEHGTSVLARIRETHPTLPVLFSTGHGGQGELEAFLSAPMTGYLLKPYDLQALIVAIRALVE